MQEKKISRVTVNIEYAAVQGAFWLLFCIAFNFAAVFLQGRGYTNSEIGLILAAGNLLGFALPPVLGAASDKYEKVTELRILWSIMLVYFVSLITVILPKEKGAAITIGWIMLVTATIVFTPFATQLCFRMSSWGEPVNYGVGRGVGSFFYAASSAVFGAGVTAFGVRVLPMAGILFSVVLCTVLLVVTLQNGKRSAAVCEQVSEKERDSTTLFRFFAENKKFSLCMLGISFLYFAHNVVGNFEINVVRNVGGNSTDMGNIVAVMGFSELPAMFLFDRITRRFKCSDVLRFAIIMFPVKALAIALAWNIPSLYAAHVLQAVSFALITPAMVRYASEKVPKRDAAKGQTVAACAITLGATFASLVAGFMFDHIGVFVTLMVGFAVAAAGAVLAFTMTEK